MRIVSFDSTHVNNSSASGNFKVNLFLKDSKNDYLFVSTKFTGLNKSLILQTDENEGIKFSYKALYEKLQKFNPEIIMFRIDFDQPELMNAFIRYFNSTNTPYILIIYDSWFNLELSKQNQILTQKLFENASGLITEIKDLSTEITEKFQFNKNTLEIRNSWFLNESYINDDVKPNNKLRIVFSGNVNNKINYQSLLSFAIALDNSDADLVLDIFKHPSSSLEKKFYNLKKTNVFDQVEYDLFFENLRKYNYGLLPYNFDETSRKFSLNSFSNKLNQYLFNGLSPIGFGPKDQTTIKFLMENNFNNVFTYDNSKSLANFISLISLDENEVIKQTISEHFDLDNMHEQLNNFYQDCSKVLFNKKIRFKKVNLLLSRQQYVEGKVSKVNIIKSVFYIFKKIVKGFKL
jgi:hypothetical protein